MMDIISMILSRNQSGEPLAYTETGKKYTWNGDTTNTEVNNSLGMPLYKISSEKIDPYTVSKVTLYTSRNGDNVLSQSDFTINTNASDMGMYGIETGLQSGAGMVMISVGGDNAVLPVGIYCTHIKEDDEIVYVSALETASTIHPIDPKYIPGAVLPVVELSTEIADASAGVVLNESDSAKLEVVVGSPAIISVNNGALVLLCNYVKEDTASVFITTTLGGSYLFMGIDGEWRMQVQTE